MEKNKHIFCLALSCLLSLGSITAQGLQVVSEEKNTFSISLNEELAVMGLQMELFLPNGMTLVDDSPIELGSGVANHTLRLHNFGGGHYLVLTYNLGLEATTMGKEEVLKCHFQLSPDMSPGEYSLTISGIKLAKDALHAVCPPSYEGCFNLDASGATAIDGIEHSPMKVAPSVYDLQGRKVNGQCQKGIYIVDGKIIIK